MTNAMTFAGTIVELYLSGMDEAASMVASNITDGMQKEVIYWVEAMAGDEDYFEKRVWMER